MPRPLSVRCSSGWDYSSQWQFTASGLPPRRAFRRERPSCRAATRPLGKGAQSIRQVPKPRRSRSNYNIPVCKRNPALAQAAGPLREARAEAPWRPQPCLAEVPECSPAAEPAREQSQAGVRHKPPPPGAGRHKPVRGSCNRPRPVRPGRPTSKLNRISFSYTILIANSRKNSTPKTGPVLCDMVRLFRKGFPRSGVSFCLPASATAGRRRGRIAPAESFSRRCRKG